MAEVGAEPAVQPMTSGTITYRRPRRERRMNEVGNPRDATDDEDIRWWQEAPSQTYTMQCT